MFLKILDGKNIDDEGNFSQGWVTSDSNLVTNMFKTSSCGALSVAFTQYLWRIMRTCTLKNSHINTPHGIRNNLFLLTYPSIIKITPILFMIAILIWLIFIAIIYPPRALTVSSEPFSRSQQILVPNFDPSFIGNTSQIDARDKHLAVIVERQFMYQYLSVYSPSLISFCKASPK